MSDAKSANIPVKDMVRMVFGIIYIYIWIKATNWRSLLEKYAFRILTISLLLLLVEVVLEIFGREMAAGSIILKTLFAVSFCVAALGKYREWKEERNDFYFIGAARAIALALSRPIDPGDLTLNGLLKIFHTNFSPAGDLNVTLALYNDTKTLQITHRYPAKPEKRNTSFGVGEGGAGYAYKDRCLVYIPRTGLGHAVVQRLDDDDPFEMVTKLYLRFNDEDRPYRAILSVPVVIFGRCFGVLNFDSTRANAFRKKHIQQAFYFATVVAQILQSSKPTLAAVRQLDRRVDRK